MPPSVPRTRSIKLVLEQREDLPLLPVGYEKDHCFGGRLQGIDADVSQTIPLVKDRRRFQASQVCPHPGKLHPHCYRGLRRPAWRRTSWRM